MTGRDGIGVTDSHRRPAQDLQVVPRGRDSPCGIDLVVVNRSSACSAQRRPGWCVTMIGMLTTLILADRRPGWRRLGRWLADPVGVRRRIGVVTQEQHARHAADRGRDPELRSRFFGELLAARRAEQLLEVFGLADPRKRWMSTDLSWRAGPAAAHRPGPGGTALENGAVPRRAHRRADRTPGELWDILQVLHAEGQTIPLTNGTTWRKPKRCVSRSPSSTTARCSPRAPSTS